MGLFDSGSPQAPTPPNPTATAAAQTGTNVSTAIANSYLGNTNQNTPQGNLSFDPNQLPAYNFTDPYTGQSFNIPRWTATQTLNPQAQQTFNQQQAAQGNLAGMAEQQSGALRNLMGSAFDPSRGSFNAETYLNTYPDIAQAAQKALFASGGKITPDMFAAQHFREFGQNEGRITGGQVPGAMGDINLYNQVQGPMSTYADAGPLQDTYASGGDITRGFAPGGDITRSYGPADNYSADRQRIEESMFQRVNPQIQQQEDRLRQQLADQGIRYGSQAYSGAYDPFNRQVTDTRLGIVAAGGQEQQRMDQMAAQQAAFRNAAQQQGYAQNLGMATFQNQAQQQAEQQNAARGAFANAAEQERYNQIAAKAQFFNQSQNQLLGLQSAKFNAANQVRNQALQEGYQQRTQPINEITALLSGSQVQQPNFINAQRTSIPTTDVAGLINQNFAQQNDIFKTQSTSWNDIMGGLLGAGGKIGAGIAMSDVRVKENIAPMGSILSTKGELPIYAYDYKDEFDDGKRHVGPMAQDVEKLEPRAVKMIGGIKHVDYDKMGSIFGKAA